MSDALIILLASVTLCLILWIIIKEKMRNIHEVKGELKTPLINVGFEANDSSTNIQGVRVSNLEGKNVTVGDISATDGTADISHIKAGKNIKIGDVSSGAKESSAGT